MKKKLLFINPSLGFGGAEKSLQTLLTLLDYTKYDVDLLLLRPEGELLELLPEAVHVIPVSENVNLFYQPLHKAILNLVRRGKFGLAFARLQFAKIAHSGQSIRKLEQYSWKYQRKAFPTLSEEYDAAIAYLEGAPLYFCADRVNAKKKIAYIHSDYGKLQMDRDFDSRYFEKMDAVVAVSGECAQALKANFPEHAEKVCVIENIISPDILNELGAESPAFEPEREGLCVLTMGRLDEPKGIDLAVEACALIKDQVEFRWYVLGNGPQRGELEQKIAAYGLKDRFILLGTRLNPYPYLKACDVYVQPSRFEGKSIALEEAKCMGKPILTTAFTTVADQITDGFNGSIAQIQPQSIAEKLLELLQNDQLRMEYTKNLNGYAGNTTELDKFYNLIQ